MNDKETIIWENITKDKCVVCGVKIEDTYNVVCTKCGKPCKTINNTLDKVTDKTKLANMTSDCCNVDIEVIGKVTCSHKCHEILVDIFEKKFGKFKKVIHEESKIAYKVPTRDIIEKGLTYEKLTEYERWE